MATLAKAPKMDLPARPDRDSPAPTHEERQKAIDAAFEPLSYERALEMAVYHGEQCRVWLDKAKGLKGK